jgi:hypothetical protein
VDDVLSDHRLAETLRSDDHDVAGAVEEFETDRRIDGVAVDALGPGPVELGDRFEAAELTAFEAAVEAVLGALAKLGLRDMLEKLDRAPSALGGERDEVIELGGGVDASESVVSAATVSAAAVSSSAAAASVTWSVEPPPKVAEAAGGAYSSS